jgi:hypothetical protein
MIGVYEISQQVKITPEMYIGTPSITNLFMFLDGYEAAKVELGIEPSETDIEFHQNFEPWLQQKFQVQTINCWAKIIKSHADDEKEAFDYFFQLLDEFLENKATFHGNE